MSSAQHEEPILQNIKHLIGDDRTWYIELEGWDYPSVDFIDADITGCTLSMEIYTDEYGGTEASFSPIAGSIVGAGSDGLGKFVFEDIAFTSSDEGNYWYQIFYENAALKYRPVRGMFLLVV